jgi:alpha-maltose-1-phosphate synthase
MHDKPRVLLIAELANPDWISVPLVGWFHWRALQKVADCHAVTQIRNEENIIKAGVDPSEFTILDSGRIERPVYKAYRVLHPTGRGGLTTITALGAFSYYYFEHLVWKQFGSRIVAREFDVVHRLTPLSPTTPSVIAKHCARANVPFVLGPLNGGLPWPKGFDDARLNESEWLTYLRGAYKLLPGYSSTRRYASAIMTASTDTRSQIANQFQDKTVYIPENGIDPTRFDIQVAGSTELPLRVAFVGRFTRFKGADMLLEAAAPLVRAGKVTLDLIGDGDQMPELRAIAEREQLPSSVFAGWVKHGELQSRLARSNVFAFPSIREFGGAVVLEAMVLGLVPIVMKYGGPGELVSDKTGYRLPMGNRAEIVTSLRNALEALAAAPQSLVEMGQRARARVLRHFTWDAKARQVLEVYRWVMGQRDKPDFGMPFPDE